MFHTKYPNISVIAEVADGSSDEEEAATLIRSADKVDLVILPPTPRVDEISDEEDIDEDLQVLNDDNCIRKNGSFSSFSVPEEPVGEIEVACQFYKGGKHVPDGDNEEPDTKKEKKTQKLKPLVFDEPKWTKPDADKLSFSKQPVDMEDEQICEMFEKYGSCV